MRTFEPTLPPCTLLKLTSIGNRSSTTAATSSRPAPAIGCGSYWRCSPSGAWPWSFSLGAVQLEMVRQRELYRRLPARPLERTVVLRGQPWHDSRSATAHRWPPTNWPPAWPFTFAIWKRPAIPSGCACAGPARFLAVRPPDSPIASPSDGSHRFAEELRPSCITNWPRLVQLSPDRVAGAQPAVVQRRASTQLAEHVNQRRLDRFAEQTGTAKSAPICGELSRRHDLLAGLFFAPPDRLPPPAVIIAEQTALSSHC